jgi:hypothetical protein
MDKLKEAVAASHWAEYIAGVEELEPSWGDLPEEHRVRMRSAAQAAIDTVFEQLMEPSDAALIAGNSVMDEYANEQIDRRREVRDVFKAMLSAARGRE